MIQVLTRSTRQPPDAYDEPTTRTNDPPGPPSRWQPSQRIVWITFILLGIIIGAFILGPLRWTSGSQGQRLTHTIIGSPVNALGVLQAPVYNLVFSSTVTGTISAIYVTSGQKVVTNQILSHLGNNTYLALLNEAQVAVDAGKNEVNAAIDHIHNELQFIGDTIDLAETTYNAELDNRQALIRQANANINFAQVALSADQNTLNAVTSAADASIRAAKITLNTALAACQTAAASSPTPTSNQGANNSSFANCVKAARAAYQVAVTAARVTVVTAQGMVDKDRAALQQAYANADVNLTAVNGLISEAKVNIRVARDNPDRTNAIIELRNAEFTYRTALANLLVAQETLALTDLRAPHDGVVSAIIGTIGGQPGAVNNLVPAGGIEIQSDHGGLTFIQLIDTSRLDEVLTYVDETDIIKVHVGQSASYTLKAYKDHPLNGTVDAIEPNGLGYPSMTTPTNSKFPVYLSLNTQDTRSLNLYSGMTGNVVIGT